MFSLHCFGPPLFSMTPLACHNSLICRFSIPMSPKGASLKPSSSEYPFQNPQRGAAALFMDTASISSKTVYTRAVAHRVLHLVKAHGFSVSQMEVFSSSE